MPAKKRIDPWRTAALVAVGLFALGVVLTFVWPHVGEAPARPLPTGPAPPCPQGFFEQLGRAEQLKAHLRADEEGSRLLESLGTTDVRFCFGRIDVPVVSEDRVLLLDRNLETFELAARVGHLLHHVVHGSPFPDSIAHDADCAAIVRTALEAEARAHALELRLRRDMRVRGTRYEFETAFWRAHGDERVIFEYLRRHPDGGPGIDPLGRAYRERCERERH